MSTRRRSRPGRPRHSGGDSDLSPREHILDVSAQLFVAQGFAATSTREIAEEVGIRQASLYYHFANKDEILAELLDMTVRPALEALTEIAEIESDADRLYALALHDATALSKLMHNIGILPSLPDVESSEYEVARSDLRRTYATLGIACASDAVLSTIGKDQLGDLLITTVESVVGSRANGDVVTQMELRAVAATCLRVCGAPER
jgi:AcrR family transcriptional regulator